MRTLKNYSPSAVFFPAVAIVLTGIAQNCIAAAAAAAAAAAMNIRIARADEAAALYLRFGGD